MSEWDQLSKPSALPDITRDVPLGFCWYCRRRIDVATEAWRPLPHDAMAHVDCETLWGDAPAICFSKGDPENYEDYFVEREELVHNLFPDRRFRYITEPRLQDRLDALVEAIYQRSVRELLDLDNPCRRPGEDDQAYLDRVVSEEEADGDDDEEED